jgi:hypothetical protein
MLTKGLLVAALVAGSATVATAADNFDPLINHETAPIITVSQRTLQSAPVRFQESTPQNGDAWMQLNRRVPGNTGDASYGGDWATTWGGA